MYPRGLPVRLFIADYMFTKEKERKSGRREREREMEEKQRNS